jgi:hypothetical protein
LGFVFIDEEIMIDQPIATGKPLTSGVEVVLCEDVEMYGDNPATQKFERLITLTKGMKGITTGDVDDIGRIRITINAHGTSHDVCIRAVYLEVVV